MCARIYGDMYVKLYTYVCVICCTLHGKTLEWKVLVNGAQFAKLFFADIYMCNLITEDRPVDSPKISLSICFVSDDSPKFSPSNFFPFTVLDVT